MKMGTWWNPTTSRSDTFSNFWMVATGVIWVALMIFQPEMGIPNPQHYGLLAMIWGYSLYAMIAAVWFSTLFLFGWMIFSCMEQGHRLGFIEWWLIVGVVLGILLPILTNQYHPDQIVLWFLIGTCWGWYGPTALVVWFISFLFKD